MLSQLINKKVCGNIFQIRTLKYFYVVNRPRLLLPNPLKSVRHFELDCDKIHFYLYLRKNVSFILVYLFMESKLSSYAKGN